MNRRNAVLIYTGDNFYVQTRLRFPEKVLRVKYWRNDIYYFVCLSDVVVYLEQTYPILIRTLYLDSPYMFIYRATDEELCRSQWPRCLRHEMSSSAWTLGSWVRIPLEALMFAFILFALSCVGSGLATGWSLVQGVLPTAYMCKITELHKKSRPRPDMGCSAI
jgi:hypothetical protein